MKTTVKRIIVTTVFAIVATLLIGVLSACMRENTSGKGGNLPESGAGEITDATISSEPDKSGEDGKEVLEGEIGPSDEEIKKIEDSKVKDGRVHHVKDKYGNDHVFARYYGTFSGYDVYFEVGENAAQAMWKIEVAGIEFHGNSVFQIYAYKDGELLTLKEAYEKGLLTKEDIAGIATQHKNTSPAYSEIQK